MNPDNSMKRKLECATGLQTQEAWQLLNRMKKDKEEFFPGAVLNVRDDGITYRNGLLCLKEEEHSVTLAFAANHYISHKTAVRPRTLAECRHITARLFRVMPTMAKRLVCTITMADGERMLNTVFLTAPGRNKAHRHFSALFRYAMRHDWCSDNPFKTIPYEKVREQTIAALTLLQIKQLLTVLRRPEFNACSAAVGLMLWAGVRPQELTRLQWKDVDWEENLLYLQPTHTKTGGKRTITLYPVLQRHLNAFRATHPCRPEEKIVPLNWSRLWRRIREAAGLIPWQTDALRHTYASYHLKKFNDLQALQWEMGHRSADMLRTRYLNMRGITQAAAESFWALPPRPPLSPRPTTPAERRRARREYRRRKEQGREGDEC